jgi:hypothetical protein
MKLCIAVTVNLTPQQVNDLTRQAKEAGHGYDGVKTPGRLIRRLLEDAVRSTVIYAHERVGRD